MSFLIYPREDGITSGSGKGGDNRRQRRPWKRGGRDSNWQKDAQEYKDREFPARQKVENLRRDVIQGNSRKNPGPSHSGRNRGFERPKWTPPKPPAEPLPSLVCPWCGKPIKDIASAMTDKDSGVPVHFDCVLARLAQGENFERGEAIAYIGGGRFAVVCFNSRSEFSGRGAEHRKFSIKKIFEWENKDNRAAWRSAVCDHYSVT
jgi:hypothetical protein